MLGGIIYHLDGENVLETRFLVSWGIYVLWGRLCIFRGFLCFPYFDVFLPFLNFLRE